MFLLKARMLLYSCMCVWKLFFVNQMVKSSITDGAISASVFSNLTEALLSVAKTGGILDFDSEEGALKDNTLSIIKIIFEKNLLIKNSLILPAALKINDTEFFIKPGITLAFQGVAFTFEKDNGALFGVHFSAAEGSTLSFEVIFYF
jgi:hypothetical protein